MQSIEAVIRSCWDHYAFDDATFLSEVYFSETGSDHALHLLATSYYRSGQLTSAYLLLKGRGVRTPETKFLLAKCCEDVNQFTEAESTINENCGLLLEQQNNVKNIEEFGSSEPFVHKLLGRIFSKTNRIQQSIEAHKRTLDVNPYLFSSFSALQSLGDNSDADDVFHPPAKFFRATTSSKCVLDANNVLPVSTTFTGVVNRETLLENKNNCDFNISPAVVDLPVIDNKSPPKAPKKQTTRRLDSSDTVSNVTSYMITRQRSNPSVLLAQNQTKIGTRRSNRIFQNSVKENEIAPSRHGLSNKSNIVSSDRTNSNTNINPKTRLRKSENKLDDVNNALNNVKLRSRRTPLIEKLCKLDEETEEDLWKCVKSDESMSKSNLDAAKHILEADRKFLLSFIDLLKQYASIECALSRFDFKKTTELVDDLPDKHKNSALSLLALGKAYFEVADYTTAAKYFQQCRQKFDYFVRGVEYYSVALWHLQRDLELSALAQEMIEKHPYASETWCAAGNCFSLEKEQETAVKFFQRAIQLNPEFSYAYTLLGHEYVAMEEYEKATQAFRSALRYQPRHYNAWYGLGLIYYKQEKSALANIHFTRALQINPRNSVVLCNMSLAQQGEGFRENAMAFLDQALSLFPKNALCRYHKAQLLFSDEKYDAALAETNDLKQLAPKEPLIYFLAGKIHKKIGQPHLALMNFSWGTELDPRGEQHHPVLGGERRYDEEPVTALAALEPDDIGDIQVIESDESA